jgi:hypothetical protein
MPKLIFRYIIMAPWFEHVISSAVFYENGIKHELIPARRVLCERPCWYKNALIGDPSYKMAPPDPFGFYTMGRKVKFQYFLRLLKQAEELMLLKIPFVSYLVVFDNLYKN